MRAAIYARFSSNNQREESITAQLRAAHDYAKKKGYSIVKEYADEAISGRKDDRPAFQEMIKDAKVGLFDVLIVHKIDRFARNRLDSAIYKYDLRKAKVKIEYVEHNLDNSPESIILESVLEGMAEYYSANLAREALKGMKETAHQAKHNGGLPPLGYKVVNQQYEIMPEEAEIVRFIFDSQLKGTSYSKICDDLNKAGHRTKKGNLFVRNSLHDILRNPKYCGNYVFGRVQGGRKESRNSHKYSEPFVTLPDALPAIVSKEVWEQAQILLNNRKYGTRTSQVERYVLSGYIKCSCGAPLCGSRSKAKKPGEYYEYYKCNGKHANKPCASGRIKKDDIEKSVLDELWKILDTKKYKKKFIERILQTIKESEQAKPSTLKELAAQIKEQKKKLATFTEAIAEGATYLAKEAQKAYERIESLENILKIEKTASKTPSEENLEKNINKLFEAIKNSPISNRAIVEGLLDHVEVSDETIAIYLKSPKTFGVNAGGGEGNRTPVQKHSHNVFSERSLLFKNSDLFRVQTP